MSEVRNLQDESEQDGPPSATTLGLNVKSLAEYVVSESQRNFDEKLRASDSSTARSRLLGVVSVGIILRFAFSLSLNVGNEEVLSNTYVNFAGYQWPNELVGSVWVMFTILTTIGYGQEVAFTVANDFGSFNESSSTSFDSTLNDEFEVLTLVFFLVYILVGLSIVGNIIEVLRAELISGRNKFRLNRRNVALNSMLLKLRHVAFPQNDDFGNVTSRTSDVSETVRSMFGRIDIQNNGSITLRQLCAFIDRMRTELHLYPAPFESTKHKNRNTHPGSRTSTSSESPQSRRSSAGVLEHGLRVHQLGEHEAEIRELFQTNRRFDTMWEAQRHWERTKWFKPCKHFCGVYCYPAARRDLVAMQSEAEYLNMSLNAYVKLRTEQRSALNLLTRLKESFRVTRRLDFVARAAAHHLRRPRDARNDGDAATGDVELQSIGKNKSQAHTTFRMDSFRGGYHKPNRVELDSGAALESLEEGLAQLDSHEQDAAVRQAKSEYRHLPNTTITVNAFEASIKFFTEAGVTIKMGVGILRHIVGFVAFALVMASVLFLMRKWQFVDSLYFVVQTVTTIGFGDYRDFDRWEEVSAIYENTTTACDAIPGPDSALCYTPQPGCPDGDPVCSICTPCKACKCDFTALEKLFIMPVSLIGLVLFAVVVGSSHSLMSDCFGSLEKRIKAKERLQNQELVKLKPEIQRLLRKPEMFVHVSPRAPPDAVLQELPPGFIANMAVRLDSITSEKAIIAWERFLQVRQGQRPPRAPNAVEAAEAQSLDSALGMSLPEIAAPSRSLEPGKETLNGESKSDKSEPPEASTSSTDSTAQNDKMSPGDTQKPVLSSLMAVAFANRISRVARKARRPGPTIVSSFRASTSNAVLGTFTRRASPNFRRQSWQRARSRSWSQQDDDGDMSPSSLHASLSHVELSRASDLTSPHSPFANDSISSLRYNLDSGFRTAPETKSNPAPGEGEPVPEREPVMLAAATPDYPWSERSLAFFGNRQQPFSTSQTQAAFEIVVADPDCDEAAVTSIAVFIRQVVRRQTGGNGDYFTPWQIVDASNGHVISQSHRGANPAPIELSRQVAARYLLFRSKDNVDKIPQEMSLNSMRSQTQYQVAVVSVLSCWRTVNDVDALKTPSLAQRASSYSASDQVARYRTDYRFHARSETFTTLRRWESGDLVDVKSSKTALKWMRRLRVAVQPPRYLVKIDAEPAPIEFKHSEVVAAHSVNLPQYLKFQNDGDQCPEGLPVLVNYDSQWVPGNVVEQIPSPLSATVLDGSVPLKFECYRRSEFTNKVSEEIPEVHHACALDGPLHFKARVGSVVKVGASKYSKIYSVQHIQGSKNYNYAACCIRPVRDGVSSIEVGRRVVLTDCLYGMRDALEQGVLAPGEIGVVTAVHTNGVLVQAIDINDKTHIGTPYIYFADMLEPYYTKEDGVQRAKRLMQDRRCAAYITRHRRSLFALLLAALTFTYVCIFAGIFAAVESIDFGDGLYFAFITVSTVGYGDVVPVSNEGKLVVVLLAVPGVILFLFSLGFWQREIFDTLIERAIFKPLVENTAEGNQFIARMMRRAIVLVAVLLFQLLFIGVGFVVLEALGEPLVSQQEGEPALPGGRAEYFLIYVYFAVVSFTTIGFGDLSLNLNTSRLFFSITLLLGLLQQARIIALCFEVAELGRRRRQQEAERVSAAQLKFLSFDPYESKAVRRRTSMSMV